MAIDLEQLTDALGSHLMGSISYLRNSGSVWLADEDVTVNAGFSKHLGGYGVQMMNPRVTPEPMMGGLRRQVFEVDLKIMRKRGGGRITRLKGTGGLDKGIYEFVADIESTLLHNTLGTLLRPFPGVSVDNFFFDDSEAEVAIARTTFTGWQTG